MKIYFSVSLILFFLSIRAFSCLPGKVVISKNVILFPDRVEISGSALKLSKEHEGLIISNDKSEFSILVREFVSDEVDVLYTIYEVTYEDRLTTFKVENNYQGNGSYTRGAPPSDEAITIVSCGQVIHM